MLPVAFRNLKNEGFKCELCFGLFDYPWACLPNEHDFFAALLLEEPEYYEIKIRW